MSLYIAGSVFLFLSIVWWFIQKSDVRKKKYEEAKRDLQKAIDSGDTAGILSAQRRMQIYK